MKLHALNSSSRQNPPLSALRLANVAACTLPFFVNEKYGSVYGYPRTSSLAPASTVPITCTCRLSLLNICHAECCLHEPHKLMTMICIMCCPGRCLESLGNRKWVGVGWLGVERGQHLRSEPSNHLPVREVVRAVVNVVLGVTQNG